MRGFRLISAGLFFAVLSAAGPLRRDEAHKHLARDTSFFNPNSIVPITDGTDASVTTTSSPSTVSTTTTIISTTSTTPTFTSRSTTASVSETAPLVTHAPPSVSVRSTAYKNSTTTAKSVSQVPENSALPLTGPSSTDSTKSGTPTSVLPTTTSVIPASTITSITAAVSQKTNTHIQTSPLNNTTSSQKGEGTTKAAAPLIPLTGTNTISTAQNTNLAAPQFTLGNTTSIPIPAKTTKSTSTGVLTISTQKSVAPSPSTTIEPSFTVTEIPSVIPATLQTATSISPAQFTANLVEARSYNAFFSTLNFSSPCTPGSIACLSGNMGTCNQAGNFVVSVCTSGSECFAMPMNSTTGVVVECTDKATASSVLGLVASSTTTTSATSGAVTIPATTIEITDSITATSVTTSSSTKTLTFITVTFTPPAITTTTTTDIVTVTPVETPSTTNVPQASAAPQVTTPPEPQTTATFVGNTIVPVTNFGVSIEKETVTHRVCHCYGDSEGSRSLCDIIA